MLTRWSAWPPGSASRTVRASVRWWPRSGPSRPRATRSSPPSCGGPGAPAPASGPTPRPRAPGRPADLDPELTARAEGAAAYRGLEMLLVPLQARRALLFERFLLLWARLERQGLRERLEAALDDRAEAA